MDEQVTTYHVRLVGGDQFVDAHVTVTVRDWTEDGVRQRPCHVVITWAEQCVEATSHSVYHAFQQARALVEAFGLTPDCYGSCADTQTSGMLCDMGDGTFAYRMDHTPQTGRPSPVNIFHFEPGLKLGRVAEQKAYWREKHNRGRLTPHAPDGTP